MAITAAAADASKGTLTITCTSKDNPAVTASITIEITGGNIPLNEGGVSQGGAE
jgi:hypothetical protein